MIEHEGRDLAAAARHKLAAGILPREAPTKMWVGRGNGGSCDVCEQSITMAELEYEPDFTATRARLKFHQACLEIWQHERER